MIGAGRNASPAKSRNRSRVFISKRAQHTRNIKEAARYQAAPAQLTVSEGEQIPGVIIRSGPFIKAVTPISDALRLANQIADAVDAHDRR